MGASCWVLDILVGRLPPIGKIPIRIGGGGPLSISTALYRRHRQGHEDAPFPRIPSFSGWLLYPRLHVVCWHNGWRPARRQCSGFVSGFCIGGHHNHLLSTRAARCAHRLSESPSPPPPWTGPKGPWQPPTLARATPTTIQYSRPPIVTTFIVTLLPYAIDSVDRNQKRSGSVWPGIRVQG